ncbi:MAG: response regulator transcription factor [Spirochaetes bacterium]|nr:response regulator transcription factor [Spirochaetota bacterium]
MKKKIIIVEDEQDIIDLVKYNMEREGYIVHAAYTGEEGLKKITGENPDAVILDIMLDDMDGLETCRRLKTSEKTKNIPVVMLTAKSEDIDIITGLEVGADDYITKPFSPRILIARIRALLRRSQVQKHDSETNNITVHGITIIPDKYEVYCGSKIIPLSITEFNILHLLAMNPGQVFSRNRIISSIKGDDYPVTDRSVDVQILGLRKKLLKCGNLVETVRGIGYRLKGS